MRKTLPILRRQLSEALDLEKQFSSLEKPDDISQTALERIRRVRDNLRELLKRYEHKKRQ